MIYYVYDQDMPIYALLVKRTGSRTHKVTVKPDDIQKARKRLGLSQGSGSKVNAPPRVPPKPC